LPKQLVEKKIPLQLQRDFFILSDSKININNPFHPFRLAFHPDEHDQQI
jgi:hypothetical protein